MAAAAAARAAGAGAQARAAPAAGVGARLPRHEARVGGVGAGVARATIAPGAARRRRRGWAVGAARAARSGSERELAGDALARAGGERDGDGQLVVKAPVAGGKVNGEDRGNEGALQGGGGDGGGRRRLQIVGFCFAAFILCNMDRVNLSIAMLPMSEEFGWGPSTKGLVQSSFFWGYLLTQVAGGVWADRMGGKVVLGFGVLWWSLATVLTPVAARAGLPTLLLCRAMMGVGEGVAMPAMNTLLSRWIPKQERSRSLAFVYSGMFVGSIAGLSCSPFLISNYGFESVFLLFGSFGLLWGATWYFAGASGPEEDERVGEREREYIVQSTSTRAPAEEIPWRRLLGRSEVWAIIVCHFCHNWGTFILLTWMPTYYADVLGFDLFESGFYSVLPWISMAIASNAAGYFADTQLIGKGTSVTFTRKLMQSIGFMGPAVCLSLLSSVNSPQEAVALLVISQSCDAFSQSGLYSNHQDIAPRYAGVLLGMSNTAGVLAGVLGTYAVGVILEDGSWDQVWTVAVGLYVLGTVVWNAFSTGEELEEFKA